MTIALKYHQQQLDLQHEMIVDLFAGGGGTSTGIEMAIGIPPHIAVNHNDDALSMHRVNHPFTKHFVADVFEVCPRTVTNGRPVAALHLSPDCRHHSQAAGGQPRDSKIRSLSWVALRWAGQVRPRVITLENVRQIQKWGPLIAKRDKLTGRVIKLDGTVAASGEHVPVQQQHLIPDPKRAGKTWKRFVSALRALGYTVEAQQLCMADYGAPTSRERLFMIARCDGNPIIWPQPTHFKSPKRDQKKFKAASDCIDFNIPSQSIFDRKKPLKENTLRRIAKGIKKLVLDNPNPFIVPVTHHGVDRVHYVGEPLRTVTTANRGELALATPILAKLRGQSIGTSLDTPGRSIGEVAGPSRRGVRRPPRSRRAGLDCRRLPAGRPEAIHKANRTGVQLICGSCGAGAAPGAVRSRSGRRTARAAEGKVVAYFSAPEIGRTHFRFRGNSDSPIPTITSGGNAARLADALHPLGLITPMLLGAGGPAYTGKPTRVDNPVGTVLTENHRGIVSAHLLHLRNNCDARKIEEPLRTVSAGGEHRRSIGEVAGPSRRGVRRPPRSRRAGLDCRRLPAGRPEAIHKANRTGVQLICGSCGAGAAPGAVRSRSGRRTARAAEGKVVAYFSAPEIGRTHFRFRGNSDSPNGIVTAFLSRQFGQSIEQSVDDAPTITAGGGGKTALASVFLSSYYTDDSNRCRSAQEPTATITTENRLGVVECVLSETEEAGALRVAAFLMRYYSEGGQWGDLNDPMSTVTTHDRLSLVTVMINGTPYVIVDICLRMLQPRELYKAQGFPDDYIIERGHDGRIFSKSKQVWMCGNAVPPQAIEAIYSANLPELSIKRRRAA